MCSVMEMLYVVFLGVVCAVFGSSPPVYISNGTHIVSYSRGPEIFAILGQKDFRIVGLAVDIKAGLLFWSDLSADYRGIYRAGIQGKDRKRIVEHVGEVTSLTVDWVSRHVYWTDVERRTVEVAGYDGNFRRVIFNTELDTPRGIVAAPLFGFLFWADQRNKRIERAWLDGSHRRTIVKSADFWPNQLAVENKKQRLYWVDANKHAVYSCTLGGKQVREEVNYEKIAKGAPGFGLVVFGNTALVTTWFTTGLYALLLGSRQLIWQEEATGLGTRDLYNMVSLNPSTQPMTFHPCMEQTRAGCSHLCLPTNKDNFVCACPTYGGLTLQPDDKTCSVPEHILLCALESPSRGVGFLPLDSPEGSQLTMIGSSPKPAAVAYDPVNQIVYWSDVTEGAIYRQEITGTDKAMFLDQASGIGKVTSMQYVPEVAGLFFTNTLADSYTTLEVVNLLKSGFNRKTLVRNLGKFADIQVDMDNRFIYILYKQDEVSVLARTDLNGDHRALYPLTDLQPTGMTMFNGSVIVSAVRAAGQGHGQGHGTLLETIDMRTMTAVSTEIENKVLHDVTRRDQALYVTSLVSDEILYINSSKPALLYSGVEAVDMLYTRTATNVTAQQDACEEFGCRCEPGVSTRLPCRCGTDRFTDRNSCSIIPENLLFFADVNTINVVQLEKGMPDTPVVIYHGDVTSDIDSMTYDGITRLYWIDRSVNSIYITYLHKIDPVLVYRDEGRISSLVLDPDQNRMYWVLVMGDNYFIASLNLNKGLNSYKRVFQTPNPIKALSIQPNGKWLYFSEERDGNGVICTCKTSGRGYKDVITVRQRVPTSLVVTSDTLFAGYSSGGYNVYNLKDNTVEGVFVTSMPVNDLFVIDDIVVFSSANEGTVAMHTVENNQFKVIVSDLRSPGAIVLHHPTNIREACNQRGVSCSDICVPMFRGEYICSCYDDRVPVGDGTSCQDDNTKILKTVPREFTTSKIPQTSSSTVVPLLANRTATTAQNVRTEQNEAKVNKTESIPVEATTHGHQPMTSEHTVSSQSHSKTDSTTGHSGEPKPTQSTKTFETEVEHTTVKDETEPDKSTDGNLVNNTLRYETTTHLKPNGTTEERMGHDGFISPDYDDDVRMEPIDPPYFENCPQNDTILIDVPRSDPNIHVPIKPRGFSGSSPLPLHSNYELTYDGVIVHWMGEGVYSRHHVIFKVTDTFRQTAECSFTVVLQDVDPPIFTLCPETIKERTENVSAVVDWIKPEVVDNTGIKLVSSSNSPGSRFESGEHVVNYTAVDYAGNKATCLFSVYVLHDTVCQVGAIEHGGIVCSFDNGPPSACKVVCDKGYGVNPIRVYKRLHNCQVPEDIERLKRAMMTQSPCLKHSYPSVLSQQYRMKFDGPVSKHKHEIRANLSVAISNHLERKDTCQGHVCKMENLLLQCVVDDDVILGSNVTCLDEEDRTEFFISFNITLRNDTDKGTNINELQKHVHLELIGLAPLLTIQLGEHVFAPHSDSLARSESTWLCPPGTVAEESICISCPHGTFHNVTSGECEFCTSGTYQVSSGQIHCATCQPGTSSPEGATSSQQCHSLPSMDEMTLFIIVTTCSFGVVFLCMAVTLYLQFQRQQKRNQQTNSLKKPRYNTPHGNMYVAPPPILKSKLDENFTPGEKTYSIDRKHPINIFSNHDYDDLAQYKSGSSFQNDVLSMLPGQRYDYSPGEEVFTGTLSRDNTFSNPTYSPLGFNKGERGSFQRSTHTPSPGPQRKMSHESSFSNQSPRMMRAIRTPTSDTPLITQSPLLRMKLAAYNLNHED